MILQLKIPKEPELQATQNLVTMSVKLDEYHKSFVTM